MIQHRTPEDSFMDSLTLRSACIMCVAKKRLATWGHNNNVLLGLKNVVCICINKLCPYSILLLLAVIMMTETAAFYSDLSFFHSSTIYMKTHTMKLYTLQQKRFLGRNVQFHLEHNIFNIYSIQYRYEDICFHFIENYTCNFYF